MFSNHNPLTACNSTVPKQVVLTAEDSTVSTVTASWPTPTGVISGYTIACSPGGNPSPATGSSTLTEASCIGLTAGTEYTMTVTSESTDQTNNATINLRACELSIVNLKV